jgi:hypothetical protein
MRSRILFFCLAVVIAVPVILWRVWPLQDAAHRSAPVLARVGGGEIYVDEFGEGFATSAFAARTDRVEARREYLDTLINEKLILLDAQKKGLDRTPEFLTAVERFWAQSLLTAAMAAKTTELHRGVRVPDEDIRTIYAGMVRDGVTEKPYEAVYPQIKWQAEKQLEARLLDEWVRSLRAGAIVSVDENALKDLK